MDKRDTALGPRHTHTHTLAHMQPKVINLFVSSFSLDLWGPENQTDSTRPTTFQGTLITARVSQSFLSIMQPFLTLLLHFLSSFFSLLFSLPNLSYFAFETPRGPKPQDRTCTASTATASRAHSEYQINEQGQGRGRGGAGEGARQAHK